MALVPRRTANWLRDCRSGHSHSLWHHSDISDGPLGRVYAAYGGMFIVLSLLWGWAMDGMRPDRFDIMGGALCLVGMAVIMYAPRG